MRKALSALACTGAVAVSLLHAAGTSTVVDAAMAGNRDALRALLQSGADVNTSLADGMTALHYAAIKNDAEMASMLLVAGANPKATTRIGGYTPLLLASRTGNADAMAAVLAAGADPNGATVNG